jgi:hypothetical protein
MTIGERSLRMTDCSETITAIPTAEFGKAVE